MNTAVEVNGSTPRTTSVVAVLACAWPALLLATLCLFPYLDKPFLIDDPWFLMMAQQIVKHPARPMDFNICWGEWPSSEGCKNIYQFESGNVLMGQIAQGYLLVPAVLSGTHERIAHLTQLLPVWVSVLAMTSLILRLGWNRWFAIVGALLLIAIPPFLHMASTAMPDLLATALALVAMERLAAWKTERKWSQGVPTAMALGLAGFARPHMVLLLPLATFFLLESINPREILAQIRRESWLWIPVLAGFCLLAAVILIVHQKYVAFDLPSSAHGGQHILTNFLGYLLYFAFPFPLASCWLANRLKMGRWRMVLTLLAIAIAPAVLFWMDTSFLSLAVVGCGVLADLIFQASKRRDHTDIFLLLWVLIPFPIVYYQNLGLKYLLPCVPAIILMCFRLVEGLSTRIVRVGAAMLIVASTGYSLLILHSDATFAQFGRDSMYRLILPHVAAGEKVWYGGQYWSYWYAPLAGATLTFPGGSQPKPGDLLVVGEFGGGKVHSPLELFPNRRLVESISRKYRFERLYDPLRLFSAAETDRYELWRIE